VSTDRITRELGWEPRVDLDDGLRRTIRWYLENRAWLDRTTDDAYRAYYEAVYVRGWDRS